MAIRLSRNSILRFSELLEADSVQFWDIQEIPDIPVSTGDRQYQVLPTDRLDELAYRFYGDVEMKYVIARANDIELNPTQLNAGSILRIPDPEYVRITFQYNRKF